MPGIDFKQVREEISMQQVLKLVGFEPTQRRGDQWYGACPLHGSSSTRPRCFSVNVRSGHYCCHQCQSSGDQLHLWGAVNALSDYDATIHLCHMLSHPIPWIWHHKPTPSTSNKQRRGHCT
jgi:CHC2 zinc finger